MPLDRVTTNSALPHDLPNLIACATLLSPRMRITTATLVGSSQNRESAVVIGVVGKERQAFRKLVLGLANLDAKRRTREQRHPLPDIERLLASSTPSWRYGHARTGTADQSR
jgi:hypothetical protein